MTKYKNVEKEDGRGPLFEYVFEALHTQFKSAQIVIEGPNIIKTQHLFYKIFGESADSIETSVSPVFQLKTIVKTLRQ